MTQPRSITDKQRAWDPMWVQPRLANHPRYYLPWWTLCSHSLCGFPISSLPGLPRHNGLHCQWISEKWGLGFYWAQRFVCVASITNFKGEARVSTLKRIMIITLGQGTLTSWKWMGSSLWELWQEGSSCLSEGRSGSKICLACGHPVCSCVLIRRNQFRINDHNVSGQRYTDNKV